MMLLVWQVGSRSEANGIAKSGAKMVMAVSCAKVSLQPFLIIKNYLNGATDIYTSIMLEPLKIGYIFM